jgi:large repetitive protein
MKQTSCLLFFLLCALFGFSQTIVSSGALCPGGSVTLSVDGAPAGATYQWKKDGVDISNATQSTLAVNTAGSYEVVLASNGNTTTPAALTIVQGQTPTVDFSFTNNLCASGPIAFTDASSGSGLSYAWNFGDANSNAANTSAQANPTHLFRTGIIGNNTQNFSVRLTVTNSDGCTASNTKSVTVKQIPDTTLAGSGGTSAYDNKTFFRQCSNVNTFAFDFDNFSTTRITNTAYKIVWGDNTPDYNDPSFNAKQTHSYPLGTTNLRYEITGQNGCVATANYFVFVGDNPGVGFNNPGNTTICAGSSLTFPISGTANNPPGTIYKIIFSDNSPEINYTHPAPADITHKFDLSSCDFTNGSSPTIYPNSFSATIVAENPCRTSSAIVVPIYVSERPQPAITTGTDSVCTNMDVTFSNSGTAKYINNKNCEPSNSVWSIDQPTGWSLSSGILGNENGSTDPSLWQQGTADIVLNFSTPGTYTIKLKTGNPLCGIQEVIRTVCVNAPPQASFTVDNATGCGPLSVATTNNSGSPTCGAYSYQWSVAYSNAANCPPGTSGFGYVNNTNEHSANPQFRFDNAGIYTISLVVINPGGLCRSVAFTQVITVKGKPDVSIPALVDICQNSIINPTAVVNNCYSAVSETYAWSFPGATPATSSANAPTSITYTNVGVQTLSLDVTNECGAANATQAITVIPAPTMINPGNVVVCAGAPVNAILFSSAGSGVSYTWTNDNTAIGLSASGSGDLPLFTAVNNTGSPVTATILVTPATNCPGIPETFTITVNPTPAAPGITTPLAYCQNTAASPLTATATGSNTLIWYTGSDLLNGTATAPTPATGAPASTTYYVTQTDGTCISPAAAIVVNVAPAIGQNAIGSSQVICAGTPAAVLSAPQSPTGGMGSYAYQWQSSTDGGNSWSDISGAVGASFDPVSPAITTQYRRVVSSGSCANDISNVVTITVEPAIAGFDLAGSGQVICAGALPQVLDGQTASGSNSISYQWQQSPNGVSWADITSATGEDYQPPALLTTTYFRRLVNSGTCAATSASLQVIVNPLPVMQAVPEQVICNGSAFGGVNFTAAPAGNITFNWTNSNTVIGLAATGTGNLPQFTAVNNNTAMIPETAQISVVPTLTANGLGCTGVAVNFNIAVLPLLSIQTIGDTTVCSGATVNAKTPVHNAGTFAGGTVSYRWTVSGSGIDLSSGSGNVIPSFTTRNTGTSNLVATITVVPVYNYGAGACDGNATPYSVTVQPTTPVANAGPDAILCAAPQYTMQASVPGFGTGVWQQVAGILASIDDPANYNTVIRNLQPGNSYTFEWKVSGAPGCAATTDNITIDVKTAINNVVDLNPVVICSGQTIAVLGQPATGGNGTYQYQWQFSRDGVLWNDINNQTNQNLTYTPTQSGFVKRAVQSQPCSDAGQPITVTVQAAISNNTISASQVLCIGNATQVLAGSNPAGANGAFLYQWQQSTNAGVTWTDIALAVERDYEPGTLTTTTLFRRVVSTSLCTGPQSNASAPVTITINPDARATFLFTKDTGCAPFAINNTVITLQQDASRNSSYEWFVNNNPVGNPFPGFTLTNSNDSVLIKLKANSRFGCKADSMEQRFFTYANPQPDFSISTTGGCGPLPVQINNLTQGQNAYRFYWTFGNGTTSTNAQPGTITFAPNPSFGDTVYTITLHAISACDTFRISKTVRVASSPKALFAPSKTVGCSPMQVLFRNTSLGIGNSYTWHFGDGTVVNMAAADTISHTFVTAVRDTFFVKLVAVNGCGRDSSVFAVVVAPNAIQLDFAVNGNEQSGCTPHTVRFINNTRGASSFQWNFGDGNIRSTTRNIDTVTHLYQQPGNYTVRLFATNGCTDTSATESITIYPKPKAAFNARENVVCIGDSVRFENKSDSATSYFWSFGDGATSTLANPVHKYRSPGTYTIALVALRANVPGSLCADTARQQVAVVGSRVGSFAASDTVGNCAPLTVTFTNNNVPSVSAVWNFGDGSSGTGNNTTHTFNKAGVYEVRLLTQAPEGCVYNSVRKIAVLGPEGTLSYNAGVVCNNAAVRFRVQASNTDTILWNFGDGTILKTTTNTVFHTYANGGLYLPSVLLYNKAGCSVPVQGIDTIRVDKVAADFTNIEQAFCGSTNITFQESTQAYFGTAAATWNFGDGTTGAGMQPVHTYTASGAYLVQLITTGLSGCHDTLLRRVQVKVADQPVAAIVVADSSCTRSNTLFSSSIQAIDSIASINWGISNGARSNAATFSYDFAQAGNYTVRLIAGTSNGCYDTAQQTITINTSPVVTTSTDALLCLGKSAQLNATGAVRFSWAPLQGLSCTNCANPVATPQTTTTYVVTGTNNAGCTDSDTALVTVIQPMTMQVSANDSICIGRSATLQVRGALSYVWSPAATLSDPNVSNPIATPAVTTIYRVVGYDGYNCFTDTAFVTVAIGQFPIISLGPDLNLSTGTVQPLITEVQNGPIRTWEWSPATDLSCANCPLPSAFIRKDISYIVKGTTAYGCSDTDTINIKVFCENSQVFVPNAFTPDGDGINDILMVRGKGIAMVKTFRVFNRWGEVVFEKSSFKPNDPTFGWDGRIRGIYSQPEVYMYTAEVICENGTVYPYKGNVSVLK